MKRQSYSVYLENVHGDSLATANVWALTAGEAEKLAAHFLSNKVEKLEGYEFYAYANASAEPMRRCAKCGCSATYENEDGEDVCAWCDNDQLFYEEPAPESVEDSVRTYQETTTYPKLKDASMTDRLVDYVQRVMTWEHPSTILDQIDDDEYEALLRPVSNQVEEKHPMDIVRTFEDPKLAEEYDYVINGLSCCCGSYDVKASGIIQTDGQGGLFVEIYCRPCDKDTQDGDSEFFDFYTIDENGAIERLED